MCETENIKIELTQLTVVCMTTIASRQLGTKQKIRNIQKPSQIFPKNFKNIFTHII